MSVLRRARLPVLLALPAMLFTLAFYWRGLASWFQSDDFAWMSLWVEVHGARDLLRALFEPRAQGSIRPLSERAYFLGLQGMFGWNPLPFRLVAFATQMVNLALLASLSLRITGSRLASGLAPFFWAASTAIAVPMMWNSVYNQLLCATVFLAALRAWIAYCDAADSSDGDARHGARPWLWLQYTIFALGFGVLESVAVYPALALSWAPGWRRWRAWAPLFAISAAYTLWHQWVSPTAKSGTYALHVDGSMLSTLGTYLRQVFGGPLLEALPVARWLQLLGIAAPYMLGIPLAAYLVVLVRRRTSAELVPLGLLLAPLVPVLPLRDHITHYYLVTPAAGLALLLAWFCAERCTGYYAEPRGKIASRLLAAAMSLVFLSTSLVAAARNRDFWYNRGQGVRGLMLGLVHARTIHPGKELVVAGLDGGRFYASLTENSARALDLGRIYLAPGSHENIDPHRGEPEAITFELPWPALSRGLEDGSAVVYAPSGGQLRNVTAIYRAIRLATQSDGPASRVEPASSLYASQLGQGWLANGGAARWMSRRAVASLSGWSTEQARPKEGVTTLVVQGFCPEVQLAKGPFWIQAMANGTKLGRQAVKSPGGAFRLEFPVPPNAVPTERWQVTLEADHTVELPDRSHASILISAIFFEEH